MLQGDLFDSFESKTKAISLVDALRKVPGFFPLSILNARLLSESRIEKFHSLHK